MKPNLLKNQRKYQKSGSRKEKLAVGGARGPKTRALGPGMAADSQGSLWIRDNVIGHASSIFDAWPRLVFQTLLMPINTAILDQNKD